MKKINTSLLLLIAGAILLVVLPPLSRDDYILRLSVMAGIYILLASANDLLMKVGQLSLGPVAFYGIGAYISAILSTRYNVPFLICFFASGFAAMLAGWIIGRLTLHLRSAYFVLVTIAFAEFFKLVATNWTDMTNGPMGITAIPAPANLFNQSYAYYYYFILVLVFLVLFILYRLGNSTIGRAMQAIRKNEVLGQSIGIDSYRYMLLAALMSAFIIGIAGSFYAHFFQFVGPEILGFDLTIIIVIMAIAGGRATFAGPILGAVLFTIVPELLRAADVWRLVIYGVLLILIMRFMPDGIMPWLVNLYKRITDSSQKATGRQPGLEMRSVLEIMGEGLNRSVILTNCLPPEDAHSLGSDRKGKEILKVEDACVYFGGVHAVEHVSFSIKQGEILAIIGPNGAGKTTLLNAITCLVSITSGSIKYQGEEISRLKTHEIALRKVVRTFQLTSVFPGLTTRRNLVLGHNALEPSDLVTNIFRTKGWTETEKEVQSKVDEILRFTHLDHYADTCATSLPYGDQRLLELGIALTGNPILLLLDEPAAGMNPTEVEALMELIRRIRDLGITIVVVEHDMKLIMGISDRVLVLNHGEQLALGTPTEICQDEKVINAYLGRQYADAPAL